MPKPDERPGDLAGKRDARAPSGRVRCRRICVPDIPAVVALLARGFPKRSRAFWTEGFATLQARAPGHDAAFGYLLESDGAVVGALLTIDRPARGGANDPLRNLSSWYVNPAFRSFAPILVAKATADPTVTCVNISAAPHTRATVEAQGFRAYAAGMMLSVPLLARRREPSTSVLSGDRPPPVDHDAADAALLRDHHGYGCLTAWCWAGGRAEPFVFARRDAIGHVLPAAHLLYCSGLDAFIRFAHPLGRYFARQGIFGVTLDANGSVSGLPGRFFERGAKFAKGPHPPRLGDLAYTEAALFGTMLSRRRDTVLDPRAARAP